MVLWINGLPGDEKWYHKMVHIIFTYDNSYHNFPTPFPYDIIIILHKTEIEKKINLDAIQVIW